jgi:hypothetical protein
MALKNWQAAVFRGCLAAARLMQQTHEAKFSSSWPRKTAERRPETADLLD